MQNICFELPIQDVISENSHQCLMQGWFWNYKILFNGHLSIFLKTKTKLYLFLNFFCTELTLLDTFNQYILN